MPHNRWVLDGDWLVALPTRTRLARVVPGGLALWDKAEHQEVRLSVADLDTILRAESSPAPPSPGNPENSPQSSNIQ